MILGWTPRVAGIIDELVLANESTSAAVVVLADADPAQMHDRIAGRVGDLRTTRLVCRNGQPSEPADLHLVNITRARSIVVVGGNDPGVVKTLLAIRSSGATAPVVAEIDDARTARTVEDLFDGRVAIVSGQTVIANLTAQACRQPGLSQVFRELLDFDGDEIYLAPFPSLVGRTYGEAQLAFERSTVLGLMSERGIELNPPASTVITAGTEVIAIADDDSRYAADRNVGAPAAAVGSVSVDQRDAAGVPRRTVLVGWNPLGPRVVAELGKFAAAGSRLTVLVDPSIVDVEAVRGAAVSARLDVRVEASGGAPEDLVAVAAAEPFDEVIVLSRRGAASTEAADAESLLVLLAFAKAAERHGTGKVRVVAELLEQRHASLAAATGADDFIVSDELGSLMIAQIAERHELAAVFTQLFDHDGQNIELGPVTRYGAEHARCFADVVAAASRLGHSALGYRRAVDHVVVLNPAKSASLRLVAGDEVVVLRPVPVAAPAPVPADAVPTFEDAFAALAAEHPEAAPRVMPA